MPTPVIPISTATPTATPVRQRRAQQTPTSTMTPVTSGSTPPANSTPVSAAPTPVFVPTVTRIEYSTLSSGFQASPQDIANTKKFSASKDGEAPFLAKLERGVPKPKKGSDGNIIIGLKTIDFNHKDFKDPAKKIKLNEDVFDNSADFPTLVSLRKVLFALYLKEERIQYFNIDMMFLTRTFQQTAQNCGIYAKHFEWTTKLRGMTTAQKNRWKNEHPTAEILPNGDVIMPIQNDGIFGRQTARGMVLVYMLGKVMVDFGVVDSFDDYIKAFNNPDEFKKLVLVLEEAVNSNSRIKTLLREAKVINGEGIFEYASDNKPSKKLTGSISGNVGEVIIKLYDLYEQGNIGKIDLENIAGRKLTIFEKVGPQEAGRFKSTIAIKRSKMILASLPDADGNRLLSGADLTGSWTPDYDTALSLFADGAHEINMTSAKKFIDSAKARITQIGTIVNMTDNSNNGRPLLETSGLPQSAAVIVTANLSKWQNDYNTYVAAYRNKKMNVADALRQIDLNVMQPIELALDSILAFLVDKLNALDRAVNSDDAQIGAVKFLKTDPSCTDIDDLKDVQSKLGPKGKSLDDADIDAMEKQLSKKYPVISSAGTKIADMLEGLKIARSHLGKSKGLQQKYDRLKKTFDEYVDRLRDEVTVKIQDLEYLESMNKDKYYVTFMAGNLYRPDVLPVLSGKEMAIMRCRKRVFNSDLRMYDDVYIDEPLPDDLPFERKFLNAAEKIADLSVPSADSTLEAKRKAVLALAEDIYDRNKHARRHNEGKTYKGWSRPSPEYMDFETALEMERKGLVVSYATMALVTAFMAVVENPAEAVPDTEFKLLPGEEMATENGHQYGILKGVKWDLLNDFIQFSNNFGSVSNATPTITPTPEPSAPVLVPGGQGTTQVYVAPTPVRSPRPSSVNNNVPAAPATYVHSAPATQEGLVKRIRLTKTPTPPIAGRPTKTPTPPIAPRPTKTPTPESGQAAPEAVPTVDGITPHHRPGH